MQRSSCAAVDPGLYCMVCFYTRCKSIIVFPGSMKPKCIHVTAQRISLQA